MSWIRLDDQIAHHPKFLKAGLSSWLWVCCIGFAQKFLTDGFIPYEAVASLAGCIERPQNHIDRLVKVGLLDKADGGYQVHDYLAFNDTAEVVKARRAADRIRKVSARTAAGQPPDSRRNPTVVLARAPASHPIPSKDLNINNKLVRSAGVSSKAGNGNNGQPTARSKRPIYQSDRFVVFEWQLDDLTRLLGPHTDNFDLHQFFDDLSQQSRDAGLVIPQRDSGVWLQAQVLAEAQRRGLPIAIAALVPRLGKHNTRLAQMLAKIKAEASTP